MRSPTTTSGSENEHENENEHESENDGGPRTTPVGCRPVVHSSTSCANVFSAH
ncbi:hypothetical protein HSB1_20970 [Halogranum salarium B-1]|uniref:Uncharacterized protein n=1 Tax=Halogranum salarium B-1 TaxID=1210908 RepID=J3JG97_9EURY|nr:hypothetical protein HSB1_20970 [Halogranum salarium B-1]